MDARNLQTTSSKNKALGSLWRRPLPPAAAAAAAAGRVTCFASHASPRWMKVVQAPEWGFYWGSSSLPSPDTGRSRANSSNSSSSSIAGTAVAAAAAAHSTTQEQQQQQRRDHQALLSAINAAETHWGLLELAAARRDELQLPHWLRLLFRLFVQLHEDEELQVHPDQLLELHQQLPGLMAAAADQLCLEAAACTLSGTADQQQQQQQRTLGQLADMMFALATHSLDCQGVVSSSSSSSTADPCYAWSLAEGCTRLLDAGAAYLTASGGDSSRVPLLARVDAVSLLWASGQMAQLQQLQQQLARQQPVTITNGPSTPAAAATVSLEQQTALVCQLSRHIASLVQESNNTSGSGSSTGRAAAILEPWHPEDLIDAVVGLAAAGRVLPGVRSPASAALLDAAGHEIYRQLSNRHSSSGTGSFTVEGIVSLLQSYAALQYQDGPSLRMFDAVAGWLVKRIRARHVQAPSKPQQLADVTAAFASLHHRSVVVPELLTALGQQASMAAAAAIELHAAAPADYHCSSSSSYCQWQLPAAAAFLQSHLELGFAPSGVTLMSLMPALLLHLEPTGQLADEAGEAAAVADSEEPEGGASARAADALRVLEALAQLKHHPGDRVLAALVSTAWSARPHETFSQQQLLSLLFSTAQLAAAPGDPAAAGAAADALVLATLDGGKGSTASSTRRCGLSAAELVRLLWSLVVLDVLELPRLGWLLVALAGSSGWDRLEQEQLLVLHQAQLVLGTDGEEMAAEVLPAQLLKRAATAWQQWCQQHSVLLSQLAACGDDGDGSSSDSRTRRQAPGMPPGCDAELWAAHHRMARWLDGNSSGGAQHVCLCAAQAGASQQQPEGRVLLGAWLLQQPPAVLPELLQQQRMPLQCSSGPQQQSEGSSGQGAARQPLMVLLCQPDHYSSNEPRRPLGAAVRQTRVMQACCLQAAGSSGGAAGVVYVPFDGI